MSEQTLALVTGANQGIGYEVAAGLGAFGWSVGVGDRDPERQQVAVAKLRADGVDAFPVPIDVTDDASVAGAARQIEKHAGRLDVLVNNAGATGAWPQNPVLLQNAATGLTCRFQRVIHAAWWYSLITPPSTFRRCTGAVSGTTTGSS